ncbi:hypothetical protein QIS74_09362 [Colletotrichum tabaci]|uniref:Uncharacterized protein n=1 Tax=Colletotrichum tabaci TaxID=1209068 RepID=A0AAV9T456_9PEZI
MADRQLMSRAHANQEQAGQEQAQDVYKQVDRYPASITSIVTLVTPTSVAAAGGRRFVLVLACRCHSRLVGFSVITRTDLPVAVVAGMVIVSAISLTVVLVTVSLAAEISTTVVVSWGLVVVVATIVFVSTIVTTTVAVPAGVFLTTKSVSARVVVTIGALVTTARGFYRLEATLELFLDVVIRFPVGAGDVFLS